MIMLWFGRFPDKVINLHPALPGEYAGTHSIQRAFADYQSPAQLITANDNS